MEKDYVKMVKICGWCNNWICDDPEHLNGHCRINRLDKFAEEISENCTCFDHKDLD